MKQDGTIKASNQIHLLLLKAYASRVNNLRQSIDLGEQALQASLALGDHKLIARSLNQLSLFHMIKGDYEMSLQQAKEAITYFEELKDESGIADAKYTIGGIYYKTDNFHLGLVYLIDALSIYKQFNDYHNIARTLKSMGTIYDFFGDHSNSRKAYEGSIEAARQVNDLNLVSNAFNPLSGLLLKQDKPNEAMDLILQSIEMKEQTGDTRGLAFSIYGRGKVYAYLKEFEKAEADYRAALEIHEQMGERLGKGMILFKLGELYLAQNKIEKAKEFFYETLNFCNTYTIVYIKIKTYYKLYEIFSSLGDPRKALEILENYVSLRESVINTQTMMVIRNYEMITRMQTLELEARLEKEKAQMMEKQAMAEHKAKVKQDFLSTMSHEIRTPLNAILSIAALLDEAHFDDEDRNLFQSMKLASKNLLMLINDILDFTKLDSGNIRLEPRPTDLHKFLNDLCNTYKGMAIEKGLSVTLRVDQQIGNYYETDETKLGQILGNIISNAIKYTDTGFIRVQATRISEEADHELIEFKVSDSGPGIAHHVKEHIFESFYQPDSVTTRKQGGSGLGLAIVKKLVELHQSTIHVETILGQGSSFYFTLSLKRSVKPVKIPVSRSDQLNKKTVLIAEDNLVNAIVCRKLLSNWGVLSDHAQNGMEAIEMAGLKKYDFILMDIHMPEMNGFEAARIISETDNLNRTTPIFALTADISSEFRDKQTRYFKHLLRKPIEVDKLFEAISTI